MERIRRGAPGRGGARRRHLQNHDPTTLRSHNDVIFMRTGKSERLQGTDVPEYTYAAERLEHALVVRADELQDIRPAAQDNLLGLWPGERSINRVLRTSGPCGVSVQVSHLQGRRGNTGRPRTSGPRKFLNARWLHQRQQPYRDGARLLQREVVQEHGVRSMLDLEIGLLPHATTAPSKLYMPYPSQARARTQERGQEIATGQKTEHHHRRLARGSRTKIPPSFLPLQPPTPALSWHLACATHRYTMSSRRRAHGAVAPARRMCEVSWAIPWAEAPSTSSLHGRRALGAREPGPVAPWRRRPHGDGRAMSSRAGRTRTRQVRKEGSSAGWPGRLGRLGDGRARRQRSWKSCRE